VEKLSNLFLTTIDSTVPKIIINPDNQIPLPPHIINLIKYKNKLRRQWHAKNYNYSDYTLKSQIKCLNVMISRQISAHYNQHFTTKLKAIRPDNNLYKNIKQFSGYKARSKFPNLLTSTENANPQIHATTEEKAEAMGSFFENIHKKNMNLGDPTRTAEIITTIHQEQKTPLIYFNSIQSADQSTTHFHPFPNNQNTPIHHIDQPINIPGQRQLTQNNQTYMNFTTPNELIEIVKSKNNKKSFGTDGLPNYALRKLPNKFFVFIAILFNQMFNAAYCPKAWKTAIVMPILKPGKIADNITSYRPIALLCCLSKTYESFLLKKILNHSTDNKIISDEQFGFRPNHSTNHALTKLWHDVTTSLNTKAPTICVALDCEKAFDTVWIEGLVYKMKYLFGFHSHLCQVIYDYLTNRKFKVKIDNVYSADHEIAAGLPQGMVMSPILYSVYTADIPPPQPCPQLNINKILYADDILIYSSSKNAILAQSQINKYLNYLHSYLQDWKISINIAKCQTITFYGTVKSITRKIKKDLNNLNLKINSQTIKQTKNLKYLGVTFSHNLKFYLHTRNAINKTTKSFHSFRNIIYNKKGLTTSTKLLLYKQLLRPIMAYGFPVWCDISSAQMEKLRIQERKYLRLFAHIGRKPGSYYHINNNSLYKITKIDRIDRLLTKHNIKFHENIHNTKNQLLLNCLNKSDNYYANDSNKFKSPFYFKYLINNNKLYENNNLIYYHKRIRGEGNGPVYNMNQNAQA